MKMMRVPKSILLTVLCLVFTGTSHAQEIDDPLEEMNRGVFWFNDKVDRYFLEPVAEGYDFVMPDRAQRGITNFFDNLAYPQCLLSDVVQLKFGQALDHTGRFVINSTLGLFGFIDVAKEFGLPRHDEDFGLALAYHGVPHGPYLVLPILGPSSVRDGFGRLVDGLIHPFSIVSYTDADAKLKDVLLYGGRAVELVQTRANLVDAIDASRSSSVDEYLFVQGAWVQYRRGLLFDGNPPEEEDEFFEEEGEVTLGHVVSEGGAQTTDGD